MVGNDHGAVVRNERRSGLTVVRCDHGNLLCSVFVKLCGMRRYVWICEAYLISFIPVVKNAHSL